MLNMAFVGEEGEEEEEEMHLWMQRLKKEYISQWKLFKVVCPIPVLYWTSSTINSSIWHATEYHDKATVTARTNTPVFAGFD